MKPSGTTAIPTDMPGVKIYSAKLCPFCSAAKRLLGNKGVEVEEIQRSL